MAYGISHSFTEVRHGDKVLRNIVSVNGLVYGLRFYVCSTITHSLDNLKRMRTITHAAGTRPSFRPSVQLEKSRAGNEAR